MINNLRDLGGIATMDGRVIRKGMLVRSAHLGNATKEDLAGISAVIDLRTPREREEAPDRFYHCEYHPMPIFYALTAGISHEEESRKSRVPDMRWLYRMLVSECNKAFEEVLRTILSHDYGSGAILWHCSEGKDRCGLTTALALELLGVDREAIMKDYLLTNIVNEPKATAIRSRLLPQDEDLANDLYRAYIADEEYLENAWEAMGNGYFEERIQLDLELVEKFRDTVLIEG